MPSLDDVHTVVTRIETTLDALVNTTADQETRIRGLEAFRGRMKGAGTVLTGFLALLTAAVTGLFSRST